MYRYLTLDEARSALNEANLDVVADFGDEAADAYYPDLVRTIAADCAPEIASDLYRREGVLA